MKWRLIDSGFSHGAFNMSVDRALFENYKKGDLPVFRVYGWRPPAISLGRFQNPAKFLNMEKCAEKGISVVRRITGGGAIFHDQELTYSFVCGDDIFQGLSVKESYKEINRFLTVSYRELGIDASYHLDLAESFSATRSSFCFAGREPYDIVANGLKIGGNAQRRAHGKIFQHGSIPLSVDLEKVSEFFLDQNLVMKSGAKGILDMGASASFETIKEVIVKNFFENVSAEFFPDSLTKEEESLACEFQGKVEINAKISELA